MARYGATCTGIFSFLCSLRLSVLSLTLRFHFLKMFLATNIVQEHYDTSPLPLPPAILRHRHLILAPNCRTAEDDEGLACSDAGSGTVPAGAGIVMHNLLFLSICASVIIASTTCYQRTTHTRRCERNGIASNPIGIPGD